MISPKSPYQPTPPSAPPAHVSVLGTWERLDLSAEQRERVAAIEGEYGPKIIELQKQLDQLRSEENRKRNDVLTDKQKSRLCRPAQPPRSPKETWPDPRQ
jgi:hypothetical protein